MALHLAVALDGAGWHPAAWREPAARPTELFTAGYWTDLIQRAERGLLDFVTIEDALAPQSTSRTHLDDRTDQVRGRLDAVLIAARVAPVTSHIGLVPSISAFHTEPFHISKSIASLDYASTGRAGVRVQFGGAANELTHFGRRSAAASADLEATVAEGADYVEVVRRLWDSWEDDAEIRDAATGRFIDRDKIHYIDFRGEFFDVKGPSITPRPPQAQPLVTALAHATPVYRFAARAADLVYVTPKDTADARAIVDEVRGFGDIPHIFGDLVVFLDDTPGQAKARRERLDERAEFKSDALIFTGTASELADLLLELSTAGLSGFRLRPGALPDDLDRITDQLVPELQRRNAFRTEYAAETLRERFGLSRPANRYVLGASK